MFEGNNLGVYRNNEWWSNLIFNSVLNYDATFAKNHHIAAIAGYEQQTMDYERSVSTGKAIPHRPLRI
jgi:hypothetical protein